MTKTARDVCAEAGRTLNLIGEGDSLEAETFVRLKAHMVDIFETLNGNPYRLAFDWTIETVPTGAFLPFARAVAGSAATGYERPDLVSMYDAGIRGLRAFAAHDLTDDNHVTRGVFY